MRKIQVLGAFVAALALSAMLVASASATLWLDNGKSLEKEEPASVHGKLILHHTGGLAGSLLIECTGLFDGTVGPGALDLITLALGLKGEEDLVSCEVTSGSIFCATGTLVTVHAIELPWHTLLVLEGTTTVDEFLSGGYEVLCNGSSVSCKGTDKAKFTKNDTSGSEFEFFAAKKNACSDGGEGTTLGNGLVLLYTVS